MFDFGFWEVLMIGVIGLLVVGPDRLPALATRAGRFIGRIRLKARRLTAEIQQELEAEHLKTLVDEQGKELESVRQEARQVRQTIDHAARTARHGGAAGPHSHPADMMNMIEVDGPSAAEPPPEREAAAGTDAEPEQDTAPGAAADTASAQADRHGDGPDRDEPGGDGPDGDEPPAETVDPGERR